eukprot:CAMPEP_0174888232 /NCGR_PEP_ID=MMETSP0167-20121228/3505_1 /TAXON_ID=38298 /ORGANISM="Rhodella maculata, Strain CCMP736" /LENGTH=229 /DNA_ID=CAMNT_0016125119 /DNA_START=426 /DNA_END=1111 /DNA_ORIENTATION=-
MWMNDPNGMFKLDAVYHLYYQHHPNSTNWGPMHWGHATSRDLVHWTHHPIALAPDSLGYIFSGSTVVDAYNTAGRGAGTIVAFFTHHDHKTRNESQSVAYSADGGFTFEKFEGNPVISNPGLRAFRDPKVSWDSGTAQWVMVVGGGYHVRFYGSKNTRDWRLLSTFGESLSTPGAVWECPDMIAFAAPANHSAAPRHALLVSVSKGGPNGGSGTRYFLGTWNGTTFSLP